MARTYDQFSGAVQVLKMPRIGTFNGTIAAAAALSTFKVPPGVNGEVLGYSMAIGVGGTVAAAGPKITVVRSLAGTGSTPLGTISLVGTYADAATVSGTVTSTGTFIAGDTLIFKSVAGTVALELTEIDAYVTWRERYA